MRGAIGVILFSDPDDITAGDIDKVYPDDWWLPPSGAQRGSIYIGVGDPLTPGYPAISKTMLFLLFLGYWEKFTTFFSQKTR